MKTKNLFMTLGLTLALGVGVAVSAHSMKEEPSHADATYLYLKPGLWAADGARFAAYFYGAGELWKDMAVVATDADTYQVEVTGAYTSVIFCRMNPGTTDNNWGNKWNQSPDLAISGNEGKRYDVTDWGAGNWESDPYVVPVPDTDFPAEAGYYIVGTESSWTFTGATKMETPSEGTDKAEIIKYAAKAGEKFKIRYGTTSTKEWLVFANAGESADEDGNYVVGEADKYLNIYVNKDKEVYVFEWSEPDTDFPAEEGYYIVGTKSEWKFDGATKMGPGTKDDNLAELIGYEAAKDEEFRVRFGNTTIKTWQDWGDAEDPALDGDNYVVTEAKKINIYVNKDGKVYVSDWEEPDTDFPAEAGYYIVGTESSWTFTGATKMETPSEGTDKAEIIKYAAKAGEKFKIRYGTTSTKEWLAFGGEPELDEDGNYVIGEAAKFINIFVNENDEVYVSDWVEPDTDFPAEEGYYIVGTESEWKFAGATKLGAGEGEDHAQIIKYAAKAGEKFKIRYGTTSTKEWLVFGGEQVLDEDGNYVVGESAKFIDIYVNKDNEVWVFDWVQKYDISIYDVLFEGKVKASTAAEPHVAKAIEGVDFEYNLPAKDGYIARGLYTDAACSVAYEATKYTAAATLYAKYTRTGYYVAGDATYTGAEATAWKVDGASYLTTEVNDTERNFLEGTITIPASASKETPVKVKPLQYVGPTELNEDGWEGITYEGLGEDYGFVSLDKDSNLVFEKGGTFAVYVTKGLVVYLSEGVQAFLTQFLSETGNVCVVDETEHVKTDPSRFTALWVEFAKTYNSLSSSEKEGIEAVGSDYYGGPETDDTHKVVARYNYIMRKYAADYDLADFIFEQPASAFVSHEISVGTNNINGNALFVIIALVAVSMISTATVVIIKKRK